MTEKINITTLFNILPRFKLSFLVFQNKLHKYTILCIYLEKLYE